MNRRLTATWLGLGRRLGALEEARRARLRRPVRLEDKMPLSPRKETRT